MIKITIPNNNIRERRREEYVNKNRDSHDRFPAYESLAHKQDFLDRPIVNEYLEEKKSDGMWKSDGMEEWCQAPY